MAPLRHWLCVSCVALLGCVATSIPDPPDLTPPTANQIVAEPYTAIMPPIETTIRANAGTTLAGALLRATPVSARTLPTSAPIANDGSFVIRVNAVPNEVLRLQLFSGEHRSPPFDVIVPDTTMATRPVALTPATSNACLELEPDLELILLGARAGVDTSGQIEVHNGCTGAVQVSAGLRPLPVSDLREVAPDDGELTVQPIPGMIEPGGSQTITVHVSPTPAGTYEQLLFLSLRGAITEDRPMSIRIFAD
jgi:hypothetical protein